MQCACRRACCRAPMPSPQERAARLVSLEIRTTANGYRELGVGDEGGQSATSGSTGAAAGQPRPPRTTCGRPGWISALSSFSMRSIGGRLRAFTAAASLSASSPVRTRAWSAIRRRSLMPFGVPGSPKLFRCCLPPRDSAEVSSAYAAHRKRHHHPRCVIGSRDHLISVGV